MTDEEIVIQASRNGLILWRELIKTEDFEVMAWLQSYFRRWDGSRGHFEQIRQHVQEERSGQQ